MPDNNIFSDEYSAEESSTLSQEGAETLVNLADEANFDEISEQGSTRLDNIEQNPIDKPRRTIIKAQLIED